MADEWVEVTCHGCGHAFPVRPSGRRKLAECPGCGGWIGVAAVTPAVSPSEFVRGQMGAGGRCRPGVGGGDSDMCGA